MGGEFDPNTGEVQNYQPQGSDIGNEVGVHEINHEYNNGFEYYQELLAPARPEIKASPGVDYQPELPAYRRPCEGE